MNRIRSGTLLLGWILSAGILHAQECRYIIQWDPSVTPEQAKQTLQGYGMRQVSTYRMLSKKAGALVQLTAGPCESDLPSKLSKNPQISRIESDHKKELSDAATGAEGSLEGRALLPGFLLGLLALLGREKRLG